MKKLTAIILALATVCGALTGCGKKGSSDAPEVSGSSVSDEAAVETTTDPMMYFQEAMSYASVMRAVIEASASGDYEKTLGLVMPPRIASAMAQLRAMEDYLMVNEEIDLNEISVMQMDEATPEEKERMGKILTIVANTFEQAAKAGISYEMIMEQEEVPAELQDKYNSIIGYFDQLGDIDNANVAQEFEVDFMMNASFMMGNTTISAPVYRVKGDDITRIDIVFYSIVAYQANSSAEDAQENAQEDQENG